MSILNKLMDTMRLTENDDDYFDEEDYEEEKPVKPTSMEDTREICDYLLAGKAVVLNMEGIHMEVAQRIIDFTCGATYSMDGNLQKISNYIFIATPSSVELSGDFPELLADGSMNVSGMNLHF